MTNDRLKAEANHLFRCLFGGIPPERVVERYIEVHRIYDIGTGEEGRLIERIVAGGDDAVSAEFALRLKNADNLLTKKLAIVSYMGESMGGHVSRFRLARDCKAKAWASILGAAAETVYRYLRGKYLLRKHGPR